MKRRFSFCIRMFLILLCGILVGLAALVAVYALPTAPMARNVRASVPALNGSWGHENSYHQLVVGYQSTQLDNSTDAVMMLAAVHENDEPLLTRIAQGYAYSDGVNAFHTLLAYGENGAEGLTTVPTARYWHGYLVLLKPLLLLFSYPDIRMLMMIAQGAMLALVIAGLCTRGQQKLLLPFLLSLLCITPAITGFSLQFSTSLWVFLGAMLALLYLPERHFTLHGQFTLFLLTGMVTSYVDYLTYPLATFGMPFIVCLYLFPQNDLRKELRRFMGCGLWWAVGYFGMWAGKWVLAAIFSTDPWFWANLTAKIGQRSSHESSGEALTYLTVLRSVLGVFCKRAYAAVAAAAALLFGGCMLREKRLPAPVKGRRLVLALTAVLPFAWYFFTQNHSYNHAFFTSRALAVSVFALAALAGSFVGGRSEPMR